MHATFGDASRSGDAGPRRAAGPHGRRRTSTAPRAFHEGWVHLCNGLNPVRDGGMVPSILGMTGALAATRGEPLSIVTPTPSTLEPCALPERVTLRGPETDLKAVVRGASVVHIHGLWQAQTRVGAPAARAAKVPYLVAAHGMADPWALRHKGWKKRIFRTLVEGKNLRDASCLHALSRPEIDHLRAFAPGAPVCFVPNGVDLAPFDDLPGREALEDRHPQLAGKFVLLFYGRLHLKKGLDLLAEAVAAVADDYPDLHVLLAGKDDGALDPFLDHCEALGVADRATYVGHVSGEEARNVWAAADAFALPSYSEGFSMAVLEALACRLPSLISTACNFPELDAAGGGVVVEPTEESVTAGLRSLLERSPGERDALGRNGRALVERRYTWERQGRRLAEVYDWLAGGGTPPEAVLPETV